MSLRFERFNVRSAGVAGSTRLHQGDFTLDADELERHLLERDPRLGGVRVHVASPGDATRILCCKDVVQPRFKTDGDTPGSGVVRVFDNLAVVTCGPIVGFQEGIIEMSGPGAAYTPFSELHLVVLELDMAGEPTAHEHEAALREAGLAAAVHLARTCEVDEPDSADELHWDEVAADAALPRLVYVDLMLAQGLLHDTYVLGENAAAGLPRVFDPRVLIDDGVVSGNCVSACDKNTTFHHQNNPVIRTLLEGHGKRWNFVGVVATNSTTRLNEKQQAARDAIALALSLGADGAVVSKEGFGNPDADLMMLIRGLEQEGIRCVAITDEFAGSDGGSQSLADVTPEADAIVSTGNANEKILLPAMATTIGPLPDVARLAGGYAGCLRDDGTLEVELQAIIGATNELGYSRLRCLEV